VLALFCVITGAVFGARLLRLFQRRHKKPANSSAHEFQRLLAFEEMASGNGVISPSRAA
jgi:hypothetical protein